MNNKFFKLSTPTKDGEYCLVLTEEEAAFLYGITNVISCSGCEGDPPDRSIWHALGGHEEPPTKAFFSRLSSKLFDITLHEFKIRRKR